MKKWMQCIILTVRKGIWLPLAVLIIHEICAHAYGNLYEVWPPLDIPMHFLGGVAIAYFGAVFLSQSAQKKILIIQSELMTSILILALTLSAATGWEYVEWLSDHTLGTQTQKGLDDTLFDTVVGLIGGCLFVLITKGKQVIRELSQPSTAE